MLMVMMDMTITVVAVMAVTAVTAVMVTRCGWCKRSKQALGAIVIKFSILLRSPFRPFRLAKQHLQQRGNALDVASGFYFGGFCCLLSCFILIALLLLVGVPILDPRPNDIVPVILRELWIASSVGSYTGCGSQAARCAVVWSWVMMTAMSGAHCEEEASMACFGLWLVIIVLLQFCYACKQRVQYVPRRQDAGRSIKEAC